MSTIGLLALLAGCEQAIGIDFNAYKARGRTDLGMQACSPLGESTCPTDDACIYQSDSSAFLCTASMGAVDGDGVCASDGDCRSGTACVHFETNNDSHCAAYCQTANDCPQQGRSCLDTIQRKLPSGDSVGACGPLDAPCDPLASPSVCAPQERCTLVDTDYTICTNVDNMFAVGHDCSTQGDCVEGTSCIGNETTGYFCRQMCRVGGTDCSGALQCTSLKTPLSIAGQEYGYCK